MEVGCPGRRPLRRDAERNRQRILDAARTLFAEQGLSVSHDQLAEAADVAVGTVYRRFPDKESLIEALFSEQLDVILASARAALEIRDAWQALVTFMTETHQVHADNRGLMELVLGDSPNVHMVREAQEKITPILQELVARTQAAGLLRPGIGTEDFVMVFMMVGAIIESAWDVDDKLWRRALILALDGFRVENAGPLPGNTPSAEQVARIKSAWRPLAPTRPLLSRPSTP